MDTPYELQIDGRSRAVANERAALADFVVTPGGAVDAQWLIQNPQVSLYCLDAATSQAIFVEVAEVNLAAAPFVYQAQYQGAQRLFALPFSHLIELSERLETKLDRLTLLFNIGRCGSTLLHQVFNQVPGVVSLSEPDGFIPFWSEESRLPPDEAGALMKASARFLFRPHAFPQLTVPVIKLRGRSMGLLKLCHAAFPEATLLFLYRDAISWIASWMRVGQQLNRVTSAEKQPLDEVVAFLSSHLGPISLDAMGLGTLTGPISQTQRLALMWLAVMDYYLRQAQEGMPITAWRYSDLNQRRQETLTRLFATCKLPLEAVPLALAEFERDSQEGTIMAREVDSQGNSLRLSVEEEEEVRALVGCHPIIQTTDFVAPGTIAISGN